LKQLQIFIRRRLLRKKGLEPKNKIRKKEFYKRKKAIIQEIIRISQKLNKKKITQSELVSNWSLNISPFAYILIFRNLANLLEQSGLVNSNEKDDYFIKRKLELKSLIKTIALKYNNKVSHKILAQELGQKYKSVILKTSLYYNGLISICREIDCEYTAGNKFVKTWFENGTLISKPIEVKKDDFEKSMIGIANRNDNSLSRIILASNSVIPINNLMNKINAWYGGFKSMCKQLGIIWIEGNHGIDQKEIDILMDIKRVYLKHGNKINRAIYKNSGKYKMDLVEDYFGSFGKACLEINIQTEAMKNG
jgi:hypothetical protein